MAGKDWTRVSENLRLSTVRTYTEGTTIWTTTERPSQTHTWGTVHN